MPSLTSLGNSLVIRGNALGIDASCCCGGGGGDDVKCGCKDRPDFNKLPAEIKVKISDIQEVSTYKVYNLCVLMFNSCFGSGAAGIATEPGGDPETDAGPISEVVLTSPGSGYAKYGRTSPSLSFGNVGDTPATVSINLTSFSDECGCPLWGVESITVLDGGSGFPQSDLVSIVPSVGDTEIEPAVGVLRAPRQQPVINAAATAGTGATFTVSVQASSTAIMAETWAISEVSLTGATSGYQNNDKLIFSGDYLATVEEADVRLRTVLSEPVVSVAVSSGSGSGATLVADFASNKNQPETWSLSGCTVVAGGAGYAQSDAIVVSLVSGTQLSSASGQVSKVDNDGAILSVAISDPGEYFLDTGQIESVVVNSGGHYFGNKHSITEIEIISKGAYYREDKSQPPCVANVTVDVRQFDPSDGNGAIISAAVNDDQQSPEFGSIASLAIEKGGDGYLAYISIPSCLHRLNDREFTLSRAGAESCKYHFECDPVIYIRPTDGLPEDCHVQRESVSVVLSAASYAEIFYTEEPLPDYLEPPKEKIPEDPFCKKQDCATLKCEDGKLLKFSTSAATVQLVDEFSGPPDFNQCFVPLQSVLDEIEVEVRVLGRTYKFIPNAGILPGSAACGEGFRLSPEHGGVCRNVNIQGEFGDPMVLATFVSGPGSEFTGPWNDPCVFYSPSADVYMSPLFNFSLGVASPSIGCTHWGVGIGLYFADVMAASGFPPPPPASFDVSGAYIQTTKVPVDWEGYPSGTVYLRFVPTGYDPNAPIDWEVPPWVGVPEGDFLNASIKFTRL